MRSETAAAGREPDEFREELPEARSAGVTPVDAMLLGTVLLWALNITVTKYMFDHGWRPLAYATLRYFAAIALFSIFTYRRERSFRIARKDVPLVLLGEGLRRLELAGGVLIFAGIAYDRLRSRAPQYLPPAE